jgi:hypothetical protein
MVAAEVQAGGSGQQLLWVTVVGPGVLKCACCWCRGFWVSRSCHGARSVVPPVWALLVLALPTLVWVLGGSYASTEEVVELFALPFLVAALPMTGWLRRWRQAISHVVRPACGWMGEILSVYLTERRIMIPAWEHPRPDTRSAASKFAVSTFASMAEVDSGWQCGRGQSHVLMTARFLLT